jgi:hypothetical protein
MQPARFARTFIVALGFVVTASVVFAMQGPTGRGPAAARSPAATRPPLLFREEWREPLFEGERNDINQRFTP